MASRFYRFMPIAVVTVLGLMMAACWSSDTLIIPPTITPIPTVVPPTLNSSFAGKYAVGDKVTIVTTGIAPLSITQRPEPPTRSNKVANAACYKDTVVGIEAVQQVDGITYYQITCNNLPGWVSEKLLSGGK